MLELWDGIMNILLGLFNLGGGEIILILALVLILFGAKKLPELAKGLGTGIREFKKAAHEASNEIKDAAVTPAKSLPAQTSHQSNPKSLAGPAPDSN